MSLPHAHQQELLDPIAINSPIEGSEDHFAISDSRTGLMQERCNLIAAGEKLFACNCIQGEELGRKGFLDPRLALKRPPSVSFVWPVNSPPATAKTTPFATTGGSAVIMSRETQAGSSDSFPFLSATFKADNAAIWPWRRR